MTARRIAGEPGGNHALGVIGHATHCTIARMGPSTRTRGVASSLILIQYELMESTMHAFIRKPIGALAAATLCAGLFAAGTALGEDIKVKLSGKEEVPPVQSQGSGMGTITVNPDRSVSGSITTMGLEGKAAHIHEAASGKNGPVVVPLEKKSDTEFMVPAGAKLTDAQYKALKAGHLYVNVHTDAHKDGEIRGQLKP